MTSMHPTAVRLVREITSDRARSRGTYDELGRIQAVQVAGSFWTE